MPLIWQESFLNSLSDDAEYDATQQADYLFTRFTVASTAGQSVYELPTYVKSITRITWKGYKVNPISFREMCELSPATMVADETNKVEAGQSKPLYYCLHPSSIRSIRFYPTPNESLALNDAGVWTTSGITTALVVSAWRESDLSTFVLPDFVSRRTKKAFILNQAFLKEGKGQDLVASKYYENKYNFQIELLKKINDGCFVSKRPRLNDDKEQFNRVPGRPVFPANFSRI